MAKKKYKYKIIVKYIDTIDIFIEEDEKRQSFCELILNNKDNSFLSIGNKLINKKDIVYIERIESMEA
jgi:hypothetical protein